MSYDADDESFEHTLLIVREVNAYKIPPRAGSGGYKCAEWLVSDKIWSGRLRLVSQKELCEIRLEDSKTGELFASCPVHPGKREVTVENVVDSSRYFVLRIDDGRGHHAFIGLGFNERNEAFDFNVALSDHEKHVLQERGRATKLDGEEIEEGTRQPSVDLRLKEGETIRINVNTKPTQSTTGKKLVTNGASAFGSVGAMKAPLAPPPGGSRLRQPLPPSPGDFAKAAGTGLKPPNNGAGQAGAFSNLTELKDSLPSTKSNGTSSSGTTPAAGWAAF